MLERGMALQVRSLSEDEITRMFPRRGQMDLEEYETIFDGVQPGQGFEIGLDGLSQRALKRRLGLAVRRVLGPDYKLRYKPMTGTDTTLAFVVRPVPSTNEHSPSQDAQEARTTTRRRKQSVAA